MRYLSFAEPIKEEYPVCFLVPSIRRDDILKAYITPYALDQNEILVVDLHQSETKKKTPMSEMKAYIQQELVPIWEGFKTEYIIVADSEYFKALTGVVKVEANLGYSIPSKFGPQKVIYVPNHKAIFYDPDKVRAKIAQGIGALTAARGGTYFQPGADIIKFAEYPHTAAEIEQWLIKLYDMNVPLTCDIEAFSLKHPTAGIATITFCWSKTEGIAFPVDYVANPDGSFLSGEPNEPVRALLKQFFKIFKQKIIYHSIGFDVYNLIYQLFMSDILDTEGLLEGLDIMLANWDCTKLITYLATNSCAGNKLSLKVQAQEYAGNYAQDDEDIKDITRIPLPQLLQYNLVDGLSTWFTHEKHYQTMVDDEQLEIYEDIFKPAMVDIIQMQLTGMPVNMPRVKEVKILLEQDRDKALAKVNNSTIIQKFNYQLNERLVEKKNAEYKKKRITLDDVDEKFNPNSDPQLRRLLFEELGLPVIGLTKSKQPSTSGDTLKALRNHTKDKDILSFLDGMIEYAAVDIILNNFIPAMENATLGKDGWYYLFGNFNLGGTLSGRLSSSKPNLQNLPAKSYYAKLIKSCFSAPPGWLFGGLDFDSLEDKISALTTKDPNKLKVYTDGYDGHCLRAFAYFGDRMTGIFNNVQSINSIAELYGDERQDSKIPTFALTYMGTFVTLMKNCGFSMEKAKMIEERYHELYKVSDEWVNKKLEEATQKGYVTVAFGLRVRTPLLKQVILNTSKTPYEAAQESRSAGNALGQSWCLLNSRAGSEFMGKVRKSKYRLDIKPCAQIHDAGYFLIRDNIEPLMFTNEHLVKAVQWQEHPEIRHDEVKLGGKLGIFYPDWSKEITIPNGAKEEDIFSIIDAKMSKH